LSQQDKAAFRSGTNYQRDYRVIFEPFWARKVPECAHLARRPYLRPEQDHPQTYASASKILGGQIRNAWTDSPNRPWLYRRRLIKDIRANLMLEWLRRRFPELRIIFLIRNPVAVAQPDLVTDFLQSHAEYIRHARSTFEQFVVQWAIETSVALRTLSPERVIVVFYEHLVSSPQQELQRLDGFLGSELGAIAPPMLNRPSALARKDSAVVSGRDPVRAAVQDVKREDRDRAHHILEEFALESLYRGDGLPACN
jgi:hypothetical protein